jgi:hypothetical protein
MSESNIQPETLAELRELVAARWEDRLTAAQAARLEELVAGSEEIARLYVGMIFLHAELRHFGPVLVEKPDAAQAQAPALSLSDLAKAVAAKPASKPQWKEPRQKTAATRQPPTRFSAWRIAALFVFIASAVMTLTSPTWLSWWRNTPVATLADAVDAQWDESQGRLDVGDHLPYGPLFLKSGYASIRLDNGVKLVLVGPAHFSVDSLKLAHLDEGKLTADVPHAASGYSVKIPSGMVTDIGTTFGVTAFANKESTVQVLKGSVQAQLFAADGKQKDQVVLTEDHAVDLNPNIGTLAGIPAEQGIYPTDIRHLPVPPEAPFARWQKFSDQLRKDPTLLAYYTFDNKDKSPQRLLNRAAATAGKSDGILENVTWDDGRFPGKQSLHFNGDESHAMVDIPQQSSQLTLAAWVWVDAFTGGFNTLLMSDAYDKPGNVGWQFHPNSQMYLNIIPGPQKNDPWSLTVSGDSDRSVAGKWVFCVANADVRTSTLSLYRDGVLLRSRTVDGLMPLLIGKAHIGNWVGSGGRGLRGRIDELAVFSRVLTDSEIKSMYEAGRP